MAMIRLKRVYEEPATDDGLRVLVERLWPRGLSKERAAVDVWIKDVAPSPELRRWFNHDPARWDEFRRRYRAELRQNKDVVEELRQKCKGQTVTFVYAARDEEHNGALALRDYLERHGTCPAVLERHVRPEPGEAVGGIGMLTSDRSARDVLDDPPVRALARSIRRLSQADFDELIDLVRHLHRADDQEEYDSWVRAIEELLEPRPTGTEPFPLRR